MNLLYNKIESIFNSEWFRHHLHIMQKRYYPWLIWGLAASAFFIEYFARVAPGVMVDHLMHDFQVHALASYRLFLLCLCRHANPGRVIIRSV
ncbi:hypothetical protein [Rickettsiella massiliensis]|uniref:hypothetical protein n=1 Tax=Rickettsiella massiliensis TaxID=676517 RepID=UPI00178C21BD|nr:hypothetical protein [Rickettsiella massiliensis]